MLRWDVLITTYETVTSDIDFLRKTKWGFLVVDEAHRLKAAESRLAESLTSMRSGDLLVFVFYGYVACESCSQLVDLLPLSYIFYYSMHAQAFEFS